MRPMVMALVLACGAGPACAATSSGHAALAIAALVGGYSPLLSAPQRSLLAKVLNGNAGSVPGEAPIQIQADSVVCHAGDVDISAFACDLKSGAWTVRLTGRRANELFASLASMGVATDGAAGTIYVSVSKLHCIVDLAKVAQRDGSGADCAYAAQ